MLLILSLAALAVIGAVGTTLAFTKLSQERVRALATADLADPASAPKQRATPAPVKSPTAPNTEQPAPSTADKPASTPPEVSAPPSPKKDKDTPPSGAVRRPPSGSSEPGVRRGTEAGGASLRETFLLMRLFLGLEPLAAKDAVAALTAAQAREILAVMTPLRTQATLSAEQAKAAREKVETILTDAQRQAIEEAAQNQRRGGNEQGERPRGMHEGAQEGGQASAPRGPRGGEGMRREGSPPRGAGEGIRRDAPPRGEGSGDRRRGDGSGGARPRGDNPPAGAPAERSFDSRQANDQINPFNPESDHPMATRMTERLQAVFAALAARSK